MKNKNVLITGGKGFIGSHLATFLSKSNNVNIFDIKDGKDIRDFDALKKDFSSVDIVFHLASLVSVEESMKKPLDYVETNIIGSYNVLKASLESNVKKVVFTSSAAVYGDDPKSPKKEDMLLIPKSPYALAKVTVERLMDKFSELGLNTISLRFFNVYGPGQKINSSYASVIPIFITKALKNENLAIYGDGKQTRDFIYIDDVIKACTLAAEKGSGFFNIASAKPTSINELAKLIVELTESKSKIKYEAVREGDIIHSLSDVTNAKKVLGFESDFELKEGLKKTIEWFKRSANSNL